MKTYRLIPLFSAILLTAAAPTPEEKILFDQGVDLQQKSLLVESLIPFTELIHRFPESPLSADAREKVILVMAAVEQSRAVTALTPKERAALVNNARLSSKRAAERRRDLLKELEGLDRKTKGSPTELVKSLMGSRQLGGSTPLPGEAELEGIKAQVFLDNIRNALRRQIQDGSLSSPKTLHEAKGFLGFYEGDLDTAVAEWKLALNADPSDNVLKKKLDKAQADLTQKKRQEQIKDLMTRGRNQYELGDIAAAQTSFEKLLILSPKHPEALRHLELIRQRADDRKRQQTIDAKLDAAREKIDEGAFLDAVPLLIDILELDASHERARYYLEAAKKKLYIKTTLSTSTKETPKQLIAPRPAPADGGDRPSAEKVYTAGMIRYVGNDLPGALELFKQAMEMDPTFNEAAQAYRTVKKELSFR
jgi:tetratricopeptide (TPR) repeat protein